MKLLQHHLQNTLGHDFPRLAISATVAALLIAGGSVPAQAACKPWVSGNGQALAQPAAQAKARSDWSAKTSGLYGAAWAHFLTAQVGAFPCNKIGPVMWSCTVRAKPCMLDLKAVK